MAGIFMAGLIFQGLFVVKNGARQIVLAIVSISEVVKDVDINSRFQKLLISGNRLVVCLFHIRRIGSLLVGVWAFVYLFVGGCRGDLLSVAAVCRFDGFGKGEGARCLQKEPSEQREETFIYLVVFHSLIMVLLTCKTIFVALFCVRGAWCKSVFGCFVFVFS